MLGVHFDDFGEGIGPVAFGLAGQAVHEVDADVVEAGPAGLPEGLLGLEEVVPPADEL